MVNQHLTKLQPSNTQPAISSRTELMLDLSAEALKILMYLQEELFKEASKSTSSRCQYASDTKLLGYIYR